MLGRHVWAARAHIHHAKPALIWLQLGAISIMETVSAVITPLVGGQLWAATVQAKRAPLCFVMLGGLMIVAGLASFFLRPPARFDAQAQSCTQEARVEDSGPE
jgi:hypothetical protein